MTGSNHEEIVAHVRWNVTVGIVTFRCLNCGAMQEYEVVKLANLQEPQRLLYEFTAEHKDCIYDPK